MKEPLLAFLGGVVEVTSYVTESGVIWVVSTLGINNVGVSWYVAVTWVLWLICGDIGVSSYKYCRNWGNMSTYNVILPVASVGSTF